MSRTILATLVCVVAGSFLTGCSTQPTPPAHDDAWLSFKFVNGFGAPGCGPYPGTCGLADQSETFNYYNAIGATNNADPANNVDNLSRWLAYYGFNSGGQVFHATYGNQADLQLGRDMYCIQNGANVGHGPNIACYVSNYGQPPFDGVNNVENPLWPALQDAVSQALNNNNQTAFHPFATVAMVYTPNNNGPNSVTFYVYDKVGYLVPNAALDGEGAKEVPQMCMSCHGGQYTKTSDSPTGQPFVTGANFLPFDTGSFAYDPSNTEDDQQEAFRNLNNVVSLTNPTAAIIDFINGLYCSSPAWPTANDPTQTDPTKPNPCRNPVGQAKSTTNDGYIPAGWCPATDAACAITQANNSGAGVNNSQSTLYTNVVKKYCRMCHLAAAPAFTQYQDFVGLATQIENFVCTIGDMPHAEVPFGSPTNNNLHQNGVGFWWDPSGTAEKDLKTFLSGQPNTTGKCP